MINLSSSSLLFKINISKCPDCDSVLDIPCDVSLGEILTCPNCGLELEVKKIAAGGGCEELQELTIDGEDWGE